MGPDETNKKIEEANTHKAAVLKEMEQHKVLVKKRRKDEELALENIKNLKTQYLFECVKKTVNFQLVEKYSEAIDGNRAMLEGIREAILTSSMAIEKGEKILADIEAWISSQQKLYGKVIPFDASRSKTQSN